MMTTTTREPEGPTDSVAETLARQGRLLMRLSAAVEGLTARNGALEQWVRDSLALARAREHELQSALEHAQAETRAIALEAVRVADALDWACSVARSRKDKELLATFEAARLDGVRRLAALGVTEIPAVGELDGRLHESVGTRRSRRVPQYHILCVVRRGWRRADDILRRAQVITAR